MDEEEGPAPWPLGDGEMAARIRAHDWAASPLGPVEGWPQSLRTAADVVLAMPGPATVLWGPAHVQLYNDAYIAIARDRHPALLGRPAAEGWPDVYEEVIAPLLDAARDGRATRLAGFPVALRGPDGRPEERAFDTDWSPVRDESGAVAGALQTLVEVTGRHRAEAAQRRSEERQAFFLRLSDALRPLADPIEVQGAAMRMLGERLALGRAFYLRAERDGSGWVHVVESDFHRAPGMASVVGRHPLRAFGGSVFDGTEGGKPIVVPDVDALPGLTPEELGSYAAFGLRAFVHVPLVKDGEYVAAVCVHDSAPRRWTEAEVGLVREVAERTWSAVEHARAEAALRESEARFRAMAKAIGDVFYVTDLDRGALLYLSPAYERVWGRPAAALLADLSSFLDTVHPDDRGAFLAGKAAQGRGEPVAVEYRVVRPDGAVRWIFDRSFPVADDAPGRRSAGVASDVTARKEAEAARRDSEERLRLVAENARDHAILVTDERGVITDWLPGAAAVFGWTAEEAVGRPGDILFTPEDRAAGAPGRELDAARREGVASDVRWHVRKDGSRVFVEGTVAALRRPDGGARGFLRIGRDATARHAAEGALRRSEAMFRALATAIPQLVFRSRPDGWRTWGSPQWVEYTGLGFEESVGIGWLDAVHPEDREATRRAWAGAAAAGGYYAEHRVRRAGGGGYRWHQTRARPLDGAAGDGAAGEWVGASTDVHELVELRERQRLLLAELDHRVKNMIAVILAIAGQTGEGAADLGSFLDAFEGRLRALAAAHDLLTRDGWRGAPLPALARAALAAHDAGKGRVAVEAEDVRLAPAAAQGLALALHELATNAAKYGALSVPGGRVALEGRVEDGELVLSWREAGGPAVAGPPAAAGFGTALLRQVVEYQHGGEVRQDWRPEGLACELRLPLAEVAAAREGIRPGDGGARGPRAGPRP